MVSLGSKRKNNDVFVGTFSPEVNEGVLRTCERKSTFLGT